MEHEMQKMTFEELDGNDLERMKVNAFKVCDERTCGMDGASAQWTYEVPNVFKKPELFCYNEEYWKTLQLQLKIFNSRL